MPSNKKHSLSDIKTRVAHIEQMLREDFEAYKIPSETTQAYLEPGRTDNAQDTLELTIEPTRKAVPAETTEGRLDSEKESLFGVKFRNKEAWSGDQPVLEKQRLSGEKNPVMEKEKYKKATK